MIIFLLGIIVGFIIGYIVACSRVGFKRIDYEFEIELLSQALWDKEKDLGNLELQMKKPAIGVN